MQLLCCFLFIFYFSFFVFWVGFNKQNTKKSHRRRLKNKKKSCCLIQSYAWYQRWVNAMFCCVIFFWVGVSVRVCVCVCVWYEHKSHNTNTHSKNRILAQYYKAGNIFLVLRILFVYFAFFEFLFEKCNFASFSFMCVALSFLLLSYFL